MKCPKCGIENPPTAFWCDCGYDFQRQAMRAPTPQAVRLIEATAQRTPKTRFRMRETPTTLSAYFILNGVLGALAGLAGLVGISRMAVPGINILAAVYFMVSLAFATVFILVGIYLRRLLTRSPRTIKLVLWASFGCVVLAFLLSSLIRVQPTTAVFAAVSLLILWYLLRSVNRLAAEAQSAALSSKT